MGQESIDRTDEYEKVIELLRETDKLVTVTWIRKQIMKESSVGYRRVRDIVSQMMDDQDVELVSIPSTTKGDLLVLKDRVYTILRPCFEKEPSRSPEKGIEQKIVEELNRADRLLTPTNTYTGLGMHKYMFDPVKQRLIDDGIVVEVPTTSHGQVITTQDKLRELLDELTD